MSTELKDCEKPITLRQRLAVQLILIAIQILSPFQWEHKWAEWRDDFLKRMNGQA